MPNPTDFFISYSMQKFIQIAIKSEVATERCTT